MVRGGVVILIVALSGCVLDSRQVDPGNPEYIVEDASDPDAACGDGQCAQGEWGECPDDCPLVCGDGTCTDLERATGSCSEDCDLGMCGDRFCADAEYPWCRTDCGLAPQGCGNGVCELSEFIMGDSGLISLCSDCDNGYCGDGACAENEAWCDYDCETCVEDESKPQNCGDGCFSESVDCASDTFECGSEEFRCRDIDYWASCYGGVFRQCSSEARYYCPATGGCVNELADCVIDHTRECPPWIPHLCALDGTCRETEAECTQANTSCTFVGLPCGS